MAPDDADVRGPAWITPSGEAWVRRHRPAAAAEVRYDLFDGAGRLVHQVELPAGRRLVGLGTGTVYTVREDEDGLQWLERYQFPPREGESSCSSVRPCPAHKRA